MEKGYLSQYFEGVAAKRLSAVEADPGASHQHEFNGASALRRLLGDAKLENCPVRFIWLGEENEAVTDDSTVTWYDSRERHPKRTEWRLYFRSNSVMDLAKAGDLLIVAKRPDQTLMIIVVPEGSTVESQLQWLFNLPVQIAMNFEYREVDRSSGVDTEIDFAVRFILDELGIEIEEPEADRLDRLLERFGRRFPTTAIFSQYARDTLDGVNALDDPDAALLNWMEWEEKLFRRLERHVVSERLEAGFNPAGGVDVDGFIKFSLAVQNRRKSRTGYALENHLKKIFTDCRVTFSHQQVTENKSKPDFIFPSIKHYHTPAFPAASLSMLGVKSTCKERWRQVLAEAARIQDKHLFTLEPGISVDQTAEMKTNHLTLVLPRKLHETYRDTQRAALMGLADFIGLVRHKQP